MTRKVGFGIDGGGTNSRLVLFDPATGKEIKRVKGGSTNIYSIATEAVFQNIRKLFDDAGFPMDSYCCGCIGSAGLSRPKENAIFNAFFADLIPGCPVYICNDGEILLVGKLRSDSGYSLISGTGSLALARNEKGKTARAGGLGYMLGDEGSALWISWQAIRRALRSLEGRDLPTGLMPVLLAHFGLQVPSDFVPFCHQQFDKATIATAASKVLEKVPDDPLAMDIADQAVQELTTLVASVVQQLPLPSRRLALSGGVIEHNEWIRSHLLSTLNDRLPDIETVLEGGDAAEGACILAGKMIKYRGM